MAEGNQSNGGEQIALWIGCLFILYAIANSLILLFSGFDLLGSGFTAPIVIAIFGIAIIKYKPLLMNREFEPLTQSRGTFSIIWWFTLFIALMLVFQFSYEVSGRDLVGEWENPNQTITFEGDGDFDSSKRLWYSDWGNWEIVNSDIMFISKVKKVNGLEQVMNYTFRYSVEGDTLFIAPFDHEPIDGAYPCYVFTRGVNSWDQTELPLPPDWCDTEAYKSLYLTLR